MWKRVTYNQLNLMHDEKEIVCIYSDMEQHIKVERVIGAFRNSGKEEKAEDIAASLKYGGCEAPFVRLSPIVRMRMTNKNNQ